MDYDEYRARLDALRKEYADSIRQIAATTEDDYVLIRSAQTEASEYDLRLDKLIRAYNKKSLTF